MNNWKLRSTITGQNGMDFVEVNGHLASLDDPEDTLVQIMPFGDKFASPLRTTATDHFGPVNNQVPGICNGTFTHTGAGSATVSSTTLTGEGSGANFTYTFLADGTLSTIVAVSQGSGYKVNDKLRITTSGAHGSQVIEFRLVDGSNATLYAIRLVHDQGVLPYAVHKVKITETSDHTIQVLDYRSQQVFPRPQDKLLDKYPNAAAAYGLRKLRSAYQGPCIRVQRSSDNALVDIGFAGDSIDLRALQDFVGEYDGRVRTFYDQSGNGNDAEQTVTSQRPNIIIGGVLQTVNGKPALNFDGSDDGFSADHTDLKNQARFDAYMHYETDDTSYLMFTQAASSGRHSFVPQNTGTDTNLSAGYGGADVELYVNGVKANLVDGTTDRADLHDIMVENGASHSNGAIIVHQDALTTSWTGFLIGNYGGALHFDGKLTEMVLYNTDQSANRENIEKDMALYSGAYQVEDAPLLDAYGGAHAAYSLRKLNSDYTGAAIRVRADRAGNPEQDIGFDANGNLDEAAVIAHGDGSACYVKTWYDQTGNGKHSTQSTTNDQPIILYGSQTLPKIGGRVALRFAGDDALPFDSTGLDIGNLSSFMVCKFSNTTGLQFPLVISAGDPKRFYPPVISNGQFTYTYGSSTAVGTSTANTNNNLHSMIAGATQGDAEAFLNGSTVGTKALASGVGGFSQGIGGVNGDNFLNGFIQEIIVYSSDQSERRLGIERNISNHYEL